MNRYTTPYINKNGQRDYYYQSGEKKIWSTMYYHYLGPIEDIQDEIEIDIPDFLKLLFHKTSLFIKGELVDQYVGIAETDKYIVDIENKLIKVYKSNDEWVEIPFNRYDIDISIFRECLEND